MKHTKILLACLLSLVLSISVAFAQPDPPQIDSVVPDRGRRDTTTQIQMIEDSSGKNPFEDNSGDKPFKDSSGENPFEDNPSREERDSTE